MAPTMAINNNEFQQNVEVSRLKRTLLGFGIADAALVLFLSFGAVFPSRMDITEPGTAKAESFYNYSAKSSPVEVVVAPKKTAAQPIPKFSARSMPLVAIAQAPSNEGATN